MTKGLFTKFLFFLVIFLVGNLLIGDKGFFDGQRIVARNKAQEASNNAILADNYYQQQRVLLLRNNDLDSYESFARRKLNYVKPGEVFYRIVDTDVLPSYGSLEFYGQPLKTMHAIALFTFVNEKG